MMVYFSAYETPPTTTPPFPYRHKGRDGVHITAEGRRFAASPSRRTETLEQLMTLQNTGRKAVPLWTRIPAGMVSTTSTDGLFPQADFRGVRTLANGVPWGTMVSFSW